MATPQEVEAALRTLVARLGDVPSDVRRRYAADRTVSCQIPDLGVVWSARLCDDGLQDLTDAPASRAQVRVSVSSDDLIELLEGRLAVPTAWASGRLRVQAGPLDLLRMRALL